MKFFITNVFLSFKRTWIRIPSTDQDPEGHLKRFITDPDPNHMPKINSFNKQVGFQIPVPLNQTILTHASKHSEQVLGSRCIKFSKTEEAPDFRPDYYGLIYPAGNRVSEKTGHSPAKCRAVLHILS